MFFLHSSAFLPILFAFERDCFVSECTCEVFLLVMTVVEKTLGAGQAGHALYPLPNQVWRVSARPAGIFALKNITNYLDCNFLLSWMFGH